MSEFQGSSSQLFDPKGNNGALDRTCGSGEVWYPICQGEIHTVAKSEKEASGDYFTEIWSEATKFLKLHDV